MKKTTKVQIKDLKPKKDAKGGRAMSKDNYKAAPQTTSSRSMFSAPT